MGKIIVAIVAVCFWATTALAYIQPEYNVAENYIWYMNHRYEQYERFTGLAGYKTIDEQVRLEKIGYINPVGKIHVVKIYGTDKIVGYGIKHIYIENDEVKTAEFALEDSNCDGTMDKVMLYGDPVFPPDCFHPDAEFENTMNELAKDLAELAKIIQEINDAFEAQTDDIR